MKKPVSLVLSLLMLISILTSVPVTVTAANERYLKFRLNSDGESYYVYSCKELAKGELVIPSTYQNKPVTSIGESAFDCCGELTSVIIPDSVTSIGFSAFENCESIKSISIPNSVTSIGYRSFSDCLSLTSVTIPDSVTSIGPWAFEGCGKLNSITIPDSVTSIGTLAFYDTAYYNNEANWEDGVLYIGNHLIAANKVTGREGTYKGNVSGDYVIKSGTKTIAGSAFENCKDLETVVIPDSVTNICNFAFQNCTSIKSITIPDSVTHIGVGSFEDCKRLKSITIPDSVKSIGEDAFYNTSYYNNANNWDKNILYVCNHLICSKFYSYADEVQYVKEGTKTISPYALLYSDCFNFVVIPNSVEHIGNFALGYYKDYDDGQVKKWDGFIIMGPKGSVAEKYAKENGFEFVVHNTHKLSDWIVNKEATVYKAGEKHKECTECGKVIKTGKIKQLKCSKVTLKKVENTTSGVKITWGKVKGGDSYEVYRKISGGSYSKISTTKNTYYTDKKAKSGKKYYYYVKAKNEAGLSSASSSKSILYLADSTLKTPTSTKSGVKLTWSKVTGAEGYVVYRKTGDGSYSKLATVKGSTKVTYTDKSAKKGKTYTYKIKAYKSKTTSAYSNAKKIKDKY